MPCCASFGRISTTTGGTIATGASYTCSFQGNFTGVGNASQTDVVAATGKDSNASIDWRVAEAYEVNDGKITRVIAGYPDVPTALTDLGLEP